jgi:hypothetical protein
MTQSSFDLRSAAYPEVRSFVVATALACGLAAAQLVVAAAPVHAASEVGAGRARTTATARNSADTVQATAPRAELASFKSNPDTKSKASQGKAHGEKKKSTRTAHAPKKDHDNTKMAKADKKRASDESIGTSDDPLEGL